MPDEKRVLEKLEEVAGAVKVVQDLTDKHGEKLDAIDTATMQTAIDAATKGLQEVQDARQKQLAEEQEMKDRIEAMELQIAKGGGSGAPIVGEAHRKDFARYLRSGKAADPELLEQICREISEKSLIGVDDSKIEAYTKDLVAASGPDGGYFITPERSSKIITRIFETSPLRSVAAIMNTTSDVIEMLLDDDEVAAGWVGEVASRPDTDSNQVGLVKIPVHEAYAQPRATQKMIDDAGFDLEAWLTGKITRKIGRQENTSFVTGDGSLKPKGFLSYAAWASAGVYERDAVEQIESGTSATFDGDDLIDVQNALIEDYQTSAVWGMKRVTFATVMKLKDSQGQYLLNRRMIAEGAEKILLGKPVIFMNDMPVEASNALAVVYADFGEFYTIVDRIGIRVLRDPYTAKPYIKFYTTKRVGGAVTNYEAGKILKCKA
jgi:HK97 family phage major capsid protein